MIPVVDESGKPISGLFRNGMGLVVNDQAALDKYKRERDLILRKDEKIKQLEEKIDTLSAAVELLLKQSKE